MNPAHETARPYSAEKRLGETIIEKTGNSLTVEFSVSDIDPYFDGHFPKFPILPAIAQVELVIRFVSQYFGTGIDISEIRRIKFSNLVRPFTPIVLKIDLEKEENTVSFGMTSPGGKILYSTGTLKIRTSVSKEHL